MCQLQGQKVCKLILIKGVEVERKKLGGKKNLIRNRKCDGCNKQFNPHPKNGWNGTTVVIVTEQVSWFRGEDEVSFYHPKCFTFEGYNPDSNRGRKD